MIGITEILILGFVFVFGVLGTAFWVWMLIDCIKRPTLGSNERIVWALVIAITHFIGAAIYFFVGRKPPLAVGQS